MRGKAAGIGGDAGGKARRLEHLIDGGQHALARPERVLELARYEFQLGAVVRLLKMTMHRGELLGRGVLEREDRLLLVADGKDGAPEIARAAAGGEFRHQAADNVPLLVARVLRLVDQHVIDAEIELVMHPGGIDIVQERERLVDQIVIVEQPAARLLGRVAGQHCIRHGQEGGATIAANDGVAPIENIADAFLLGAQQLNQAYVLDRLGGNGFARIAFVGTENFQIKLDPIGAGQRCQRGEPLRLFAVSLAALRQGRGHGRPL